MNKQITIFTTTSCAVCKTVKKFLHLKGQAYEEVNLDQYPERQAEAVSLSGAMTVPVTVVSNGDDKSVIVGFNPAQLMRAI